MGGVCQQCYSEETEKEEVKEKTLKISSGLEMNNLKFTLSTDSLTKFQSECLIIYADHCSELSDCPAITHLNSRVKRKLLEYLVLAEEQTSEKHESHYLTPISITSLKCKYLLFVKMQPWDGKSVENLSKKISSLTKSYLEVFQLRKINTFTIIEPDSCLGVHYSFFYTSLIKMLKEYSRKIKKVVIAFNSLESFEYFGKNIKKSYPEVENPETIKIEHKNKTKTTKEIDKNKQLKNEKKKQLKKEKKELQKEDEKFIY